jgi:hypothetical protein
VKAILADVDSALDVLSYYLGGADDAFTRKKTTFSLKKADAIYKIVAQKLAARACTCRQKKEVSDDDDDDDDGDE